MGLFEVQVDVGRLAADEPAPVPALVETCAANLVTPEPLQMRLGSTTLEHWPYSIEYGSQLEYGCGIARVPMKAVGFPAL